MLRGVFILFLCAASAAPAASLGQARMAKYAPSSFDRFTRSPTPAAQQWLRDHYARMLVFSPYFDSRLSWYPNAWVYKDLYAIAVGSAFAAAHPDWILRDAAGRALYIPFACSGGTCPQYAADIGNPAFRADWIATAGTVLGRGYVGLMIDDVNMRIDRVTDGNETPVAPRDPRTGATMTEANWRRYMAEFVEQIRAAFPSKEILHNALWFVPTSDQYVQRQMLAANVITLERGFNDGGIVNGSGPFGFQTFLGLIDWLHQRGRGVWLDAEATSDAGREYGLAGYLLTTTGLDYIGNTPGAEPDNWWAGYSIDLGAPLGARTVSGNVFQREFANGRVVVNQPGSPQVTVPLGGTFLRVNGAAVTSVTLGAAQGAVLRRAGATTTTTTAPGATTTTSTTSTTAPGASTTSTTTAGATTTTTVVAACSPGPGPDADGDGLPDACDPCTNSVPTSQERAKLTLTRLERAPGEHRMKFKGYFLGVPQSPALDPVGKGMRLVVLDRTGAPRIDVTVPGGAYDGLTRSGWRENAARSVWTYRNAQAAAPAANGIEKAYLRFLPSPPGKLKFSLKGKKGHYPVAVGDLPLTATLVLDSPVARDGQCGEAAFPAPPPASLSCVAAHDGDTVRCQ